MLHPADTMFLVDVVPAIATESHLSRRRFGRSFNFFIFILAKNPAH